MLFIDVEGEEKKDEKSYYNEEECNNIIEVVL